MADWAVSARSTYMSDGSTLLWFTIREMKVRVWARVGLPESARTVPTDSQNLLLFFFVFNTFYKYKRSSKNIA